MRERDDAAVTGGAAAALQGSSFQSTTTLPPSLSDPTPKDAVEHSPSGITDQAIVPPASPLTSAQPTTPTLPPPSEAETPVTPVEETTADSTSPADSPASNKKRNRCHYCNKRVGLLGCECRCGGVFCGLHRYSDTHNCPFDYKELAQSEIRKNNPQISSNKINKI